jgi:hypothetical protein
MNILPCMVPPMVGHPSCVLVHGSLDDFLRRFLASDQGLDVLDCLGGKVLFPGLPTNASWHVLNQIELATMLQRVRHFRLDHRFSHSITSSICLPNSEVKPEARIRFIHRHNLDQRPGWVAALHVQRTAIDSETKDQTTRPILVLGIVLNHFASVQDRLFHLGYTDASCSGLIDGVLREFVLPRRDLLPDVIKQCHVDRVPLWLSVVNLSMPNKLLDSFCFC